jgi:hypothetical protein
MHACSLARVRLKNAELSSVVYKELCFDSDLWYNSHLAEIIEALHSLPLGTSDMNCLSPLPAQQLIHRFLIIVQYYSHTAHCTV